MMPPVDPRDPLDSLPPPPLPPEEPRIADTAHRAFTHHAEAAKAPLGAVRRVWWRRLEPVIGLVGAAVLLAWAIAWFVRHG